MSSRSGQPGPGSAGPSASTAKPAGTRTTPGPPASEDFARLSPCGRSRRSRCARSDGRTETAPAFGRRSIRYGSRRAHAVSQSPLRIKAAALRTTTLNDAAPHQNHDFADEPQLWAPDVTMSQCSTTRPPILLAKDPTNARRHGLQSSWQRIRLMLAASVDTQSAAAPDAARPLGDTCVPSANSRSMRLTP